MKSLLALLLALLPVSGFGAERDLRRITYGDMKLQNTSRFKLGYEWWYFDAANEATGEELTIAFIVHNPFEPRYYRFLLQDGSKFSDVFIHYSDGKGHSWEIEEKSKLGRLVRFEPLRQYADDEENFEYVVKMGPNSVHYVKRAGELPSAHVVLDVYSKKKGVRAKADILFEGVFGSHKVKAPHFYGNKVFHEWATSMPRARVNGDVEIREGKQDAQSFRLKDARGYADKQWGSGPISLSFKGWYWGRLETEDYTFIYWDGRHPRRKGLFKKWVPQDAYDTLVAFDRNGMIYETYDASFEYSGAAHATRRGLAYRESHSVSTPETINGKPKIRIDIQDAVPVMSETSFYARFSSRARLRSPDFLGVDEQEFPHKLDFEVMDLKRAMRFMLCAAFTPWSRKCRD